jgi:hypothetical protein
MRISGREFGNWNNLAQPKHYFDRFISLQVDPYLKQLKQRWCFRLIGTWSASASVSPRM